MCVPQLVWFELKINSSKIVKTVSFISHYIFSLFQRETAQLLATVVPLHSDYLPLPPNKDRSYFYTTQCFRLACERLFGLARCFTVNSLDVPASQFDKQDADLVITQVSHSLVTMVITQVGHSLVTMVITQVGYSLVTMVMAQVGHSLVTMVITQVGHKFSYNGHHSGRLQFSYNGHCSGRSQFSYNGHHLSLIHISEPTRPP